MFAVMEVTGAVLRLQSEPGFGRPFFASCSVVGDEGVATVKGLQVEHFTRDVSAAIKAELRRRGFHTVRWSRHRPDGTAVWIARPL